VFLRDSRDGRDVEATHITNQAATYTHQYPFRHAGFRPPRWQRRGARLIPWRSGQTQTLAASAKGAVTVNGTLVLAGGTFDFASLTLETMRVCARKRPPLCTWRVAFRPAIAFRSSTVGNSLTAKDLRLEVSGQNGTTGALSASRKAVTLGNDTLVQALFLVPNGTLQTGQRNERDRRALRSRRARESRCARDVSRWLHKPGVRVVRRRRDLHDRRL